MFQILADPLVGLVIQCRNCDEWATSVVPQPIPVETPVTTTSLLFAISVFVFQARRRPPSMIDSVPMM